MHAHTITIERILKDTDHKELSEVLRVVYTCYLTPKEREHYQVMLLHIQGKPQRDLGILLNVQQYKVSEYLSKLQGKLKRILHVLVYRRAPLERLLSYLQNRLKTQQYLVICLLLAGNKRHQVAEILGCSSARISYVMDLIQKRLPTSRYISLERFLSQLG